MTRGRGGVWPNDDVITEIQFFGKFLGFHRVFFFFFFFFFAALTDLTLTSKRPMNSMGPTGAQKSAPGPIFQDRHSGNIVNNVSRGGGALPKIDCHRSRV